ncbi:hypothetical protein BDF20DRAFT_866074, partial [Mycotypha africana]|uniref:uncharacterized protein n=1 Tax=Mycotypha africana TaxID=64632 RepID=UPI0023005D72
MDASPLMMVLTAKPEFCAYLIALLISCLALSYRCDTSQGVVVAVGHFNLSYSYSFIVNCLADSFTLNKRSENKQCNYCFR